MFDKNIYCEMKDVAEKALFGREKKEFAQAIVFHTAKGNLFAQFIENAVSEDKKDENNLLEKLSEEKDAEIDYILCLWQGGEMDIPSYDFRKMILNLDPVNSNAEIFVMTGNGVSVRKLENTMK